MYQGKGVGNNTEKKLAPKMKRKYICKLRITVNFCLLIKPAPVSLNMVKVFLLHFINLFHHLLNSIIFSIRKP